MGARAEDADTTASETVILERPPELGAHAPGGDPLDSLADERPVLSLVPLGTGHGALDFCPSAFAGAGGRGGGVSCGRCASSTIVLQDPRVSLRHFEIRLLRGAGDGGPPWLELRDESSNGTWLNDRRVGKDSGAPLATGDRIFVLPAARVGQGEAIGYIVTAAPALPVAGGGRPLGLEHEFAEGVSCRLCTEAPVHRCLTAVPCGHHFDLGCLAVWRKRSARCPECGEGIRQAVRNRGVDAIVETLSKLRPELARDPSTLRLLDAAERMCEGDGSLAALLKGLPTPCRARCESCGPGTHASDARLPGHLAHLAHVVPFADAGPPPPPPAPSAPAPAAGGARGGAGPAPAAGWAPPAAARGGVPRPGGGRSGAAAGRASPGGAGRSAGAGATSSAACAVC